MSSSQSVSFDVPVLSAITTSCFCFPPTNVTGGLTLTTRISKFTFWNCCICDSSVTVIDVEESSGTFWGAIFLGDSVILVNF